jgi:glutamine synthetase
MIFPAAVRYQNQLASTCANLKAIGYEFDTDTLDKITVLVKSLQDSVGALEKVKAHEGNGDLQAESRYYCDKVIPAMAEVRKASDDLEGMVADDMWPLPTYQEMLFIK